jgi:hypothetical protein
MKANSLFIGLLSFLVLTGCTDTGIGLPQGTGWAYEAIVVMEQKGWNGTLGEVILNELEAPVPSLPQHENAMKLTKVTPNDFNGLLRYAKNILIVNIDETSYTRVSLRTERDRWAQSQLVIYLSAPDEESVSQYLSENEGVIVSAFTRAEMTRVINLLEKTHSSFVKNTLREKYDIQINVPTDMTSYRDTTGFFWASNNAMTGRIDLIAYTFPYVDPNTFTVDYLVSVRDSILKENLPGSFPDSYMATETRAGLDFTPVMLHGKYSGVLRGLWKMVGDMMGGPFVSLVRLDEQNNRIVVVEGFVYAPETDKRNLIRRIEAALYTLRLPGEFDIPLSESFDSGVAK